MVLFFAGFRRKHLFFRCFLREGVPLLLLFLQRFKEEEVGCERRKKNKGEESFAALLLLGFFTKKISRSKAGQATWLKKGEALLLFYCRATAPKGTDSYKLSSSAFIEESERRVLLYSTSSKEKKRIAGSTSSKENKRIAGSTSSKEKKRRGKGL